MSKAVDPDPRNPISDVTNLLGFLLAGFGAVLSFLGLRSSEVTTVLRNDAGQASLIALLLLLGVLAAVVAVVTRDTGAKNAAPLLASGVLAALFGLGILVIYWIPVGVSSRSTASLNWGLAVLSAGLVLSAVSLAARRRASRTPAAEADEPEQTTASPWSRLREPRVPVTLLLILSSVILIATSAYGGMRLETRSQLSFSSQVGATFSVTGRLATVRVNIAAARIPQDDWVFVDAYALRSTVNLGRVCAELHQDFPIPRHYAPCANDPCLYFSQQRYEGLARCAVLSEGTIVPDATGNVDETLSFPFVAASYQDVDVRAEVCSIKNNSCTGNPVGQNSRLDWVVPRA